MVAGSKKRTPALRRRVRPVANATASQAKKFIYTAQ